MKVPVSVMHEDTLFQKLSFAHDDESNKRLFGLVWTKAVYRISGIWDQPRIIPSSFYDRSHHKTTEPQKSDLLLWSSLGAARGHYHLWPTCQFMFKCTVFLFGQEYTICICVHVRPRRNRSEFPHQMIIFPHWSSLSWCLAKRHNTSYCSINTKGFIPSQMCVNALWGCWALNVSNS